MKIIVKSLTFDSNLESDEQELMKFFVLTTFDGENYASDKLGLANSSN